MGILACCGIIALGMFAITNLSPKSDNLLLILGIFLTLFLLILACICLYSSKTPGGIPVIDPCDYVNEREGGLLQPVFQLITLVANDQWIALMTEPVQEDGNSKMVAIRHLDFQPSDRLFLVRFFGENCSVGNITTIKVVAMPVTSGHVFAIVHGSDTEA
jgi:hypothetical protein